MEAAHGDKKRALTKDLLSNSWKYDFFEAVRRIEQLNSEKPRVGFSRRVDEDPIMFGQVPHLHFPPTTIADFQQISQSPMGRLEVYFFGLLGSNGPMPLRFTEYIYRRMRNHLDPTLRCFLDIFHHRMISLFYRAWARNEQAVSFDRPDDWISKQLACFAGSGDDECDDWDGIPYYARIYQSGLLVGHQRPAEGLQKILANFFEVPVDIQEYVGTSLKLDRTNWCRLGRKRDSATLGINAVLGESQYTVTEKFRIWMGPMGLKDFERLLPGSSSNTRMINWVRYYLDKPFQWEAVLILKAEEVPETILGQYGMLGRTSWLKSKEFTSDSEDVRIIGDHYYYGSDIYS
ncbi:type VI secretion system baseplate subunit TssG [Lentisphaerota bacterium ZTH]|nr:type VI secretion system baseplate subunit TssG [Lentisphaerota bacterium]WET05219.1 type VI secretion system baseplate subunit TssG [Lentisphaerota bacterium ZTH]